MGLALVWLCVRAPAAGFAAAAGTILGALGQRRSPAAASIGVGAAVLVAMSLGLVLGAGESSGAQARGLLTTGPISGVHPMQHVGLRLDGFGPHDLVIADHVEPQGSRGVSGPELARRLEAQIHAVGAAAYPRSAGAQPWARGRPVAARIAWTRARVEAIPATAEGGLATHRLRIVSGGRGEGAAVEPACPASPTIDAIEDGVTAAVERNCPSRYVFPGDAGLAWRPRFGASMRRGKSWSAARLGRPLASSISCLALALALAGLVRAQLRHPGPTLVRLGVSTGVVAAYLLALMTMPPARSRHAALVDAITGLTEPMSSAALPGVYGAVDVGLATVPMLALAWMTAALVGEARGRAVNSRAPRGPAHA